MTFRSEPQYMFSYGMNTNNGGMRARCPRAVNLGRAMLYDHGFEFRYHANVYADAGNEVVGVLWQMDDEAMKHIDIVEGYPSYYDRELHWIDCDDGNQYHAWVYKMNPGSQVALPDQGYLSMVHDGYVENDLPTDQIWTAVEKCHERYDNQY